MEDMTQLSGRRRTFMEAFGHMRYYPGDSRGGAFPALEGPVYNYPPVPEDDDLDEEIDE